MEARHVPLGEPDRVALLAADRDDVLCERHDDLLARVVFDDEAEARGH